MGKWGWMGKGAKVAAVFVPQIGIAVGAVETIKGLKGQNLAREDKAIAIAKAALPAAEALAGEDLLNDPAVMETLRKVIQLEVAAERAIALAKEATALVEEGRRDLAVLIATLPHLKTAREETPLP